MSGKGRALTERAIKYLSGSGSGAKASGASIVPPIESTDAGDDDSTDETVPKDIVDDLFSD